MSADEMLDEAQIDNPESETETLDAPLDSAPEADDQEQTEDAQGEASRSDTLLSLDEIAVGIALRILGPDERTEENILLLTVEATTIAEEQLMKPDERSTARYWRKANESLCQLIESDEEFVAAKIAAGL